MSKRERNLLIFMGIIVVAGLAYLFLFVLGGEEGEVQTAPMPISSPPAGPQPGPELPEPPPTVNFFGGRDPFLPLVVEVVAPPGGAQPPGEEQPPGEVPPGEEQPPGEVPPGEEQPPGGGELPDTNGGGGGAADQRFSSMVFGGRMITLREMFSSAGSQLARVTVDQDKFVLEEGEVFSKNFQLVSFKGLCARFLFGDESFTLCEGAPPDP
jgi:hypothetical protein